MLHLRLPHRLRSYLTTYSADNGVTWTTIAVAGLSSAGGDGHWIGVFARWTPDQNAEVTVWLVICTFSCLWQ